METKEGGKAKNKTLPVRLCLRDFSVPLLPVLPLPPLVWRRVLAVRLASSLGALAAVLVFSPRGFAQANFQADKPSDTEKSREASAPLSHDLSGVWMQYRDGDVPGTPGMNAVNEHYRPPLTPWGQARFDAAKPLSGSTGPLQGRSGRHFSLAVRAELALRKSSFFQIRGRLFKFRAGC